MVIILKNLIMLNNSESLLIISHLSWKHQVNYVSKRSVDILSKVCYFVNNEVLVHLCHAIIYGSYFYFMPELLGEVPP